MVRGRGCSPPGGACGAGGGQPAPASDPLAPVRAYQEHRTDKADILRELVVDPGDLGSVRSYFAMVQRVDASCTPSVKVGNDETPSALGSLVRASSRNLEAEDSVLSIYTSS